MEGMGASALLIQGERAHRVELGQSSLLACAISSMEGDVIQEYSQRDNSVSKTEVSLTGQERQDETYPSGKYCTIELSKHSRP
jgi:hypothetical protein